MELINWNSDIALWFNQLATGTTGSIFSAMLLLTGFFIIACFAFRVPLEFGFVLFLPLAIIFGIITSEFFVVTGVIIIYLAVVLAQRFIF